MKYGSSGLKPLPLLPRISNLNPPTTKWHLLLVRRQARTSNQFISTSPSRSSQTHTCLLTARYLFRPAYVACSQFKLDYRVWCVRVARVSSHLQACPLGQALPLVQITLARVECCQHRDIHPSCRSRSHRTIFDELV